jgi:tetrahydromethanopterin S-methyltransferase subunit D
MNEMNQRDLQQHVTILGWLYLVSHAIFLVIGAFVFLLLVGIAPVTGDPEPMWILTLVGTSVGLLMAALGLPGLLAGYGLLTRKPSARVLAIVVGILSLVNFPVGTAIGIYTVWVLTQPTATEYFVAPAPA